MQINVYIYIHYIYHYHICTYITTFTYIKMRACVCVCCELGLADIDSCCEGRGLTYRFDVGGEPGGVASPDAFDCWPMFCI